MKTERFELALDRLRPSDWKLFEELASKFIAPDFPNLRTVASPSGDQGRDAFLFSPENDPTVLLQYSVTDDWDRKIRETATTIKAKFSSATVLVYVTNQLIGAKADALRTELHAKHNIYLDIRDRSWFVERVNTDRAREVAGEALAEKLVDPLLVGVGVVENKALALSSGETRAAFVYLTLQWEDDTREKGLSRLCFEALVRAVLRDTTPEQRLTRAEIHQRVRAILPSHPAEEVNHHTDLALTRLTKKAVRHYEGADEFCLAYEERVRLTERLTVFERTNQQFDTDIRRIVEEHAHHAEISDERQLNDLAARIRRVFEHFLFGRGEQFAAAVRTGDLTKMASGGADLRDVAIRDLNKHPDTTKIGAALIPFILHAIEALLLEPSDAFQTYLRSLADAYTLLAFLRETPDVQAALSKMFSHGEVWLDASIILPLLAETLVEPSQRRLTKTLNTARELGFTFHVTEGVIEEVERHINRSITCSRTRAQDWRAAVPFLYSAYAVSGRPLREFGGWIEEFCGPARPMDDIAEYLDDLLGMKRGSLEQDAGTLPRDLRAAVQEIWHEAKQRSHQAYRRDMDSLTEQRLVAHDVENYLGVVARRKSQSSSPFGYTTWWLTLDRTAFEAKEQLRQRLDCRPPDTPVLSPDFLANYIAFGPVRARLPKHTESMLPLALDIGGGDFLPPEILEISEKVREESAGLPERVIRRRVRDALDAAKARLGSIAQGGVGGMRRDLEKSIRETAKKQAALKDRGRP